METSEFLRRVYGQLRDGYLSVTTLENGASRTKWFSSGQLDDMAAYAIEAGNTHNTYFGINPREKVLGVYQRGSREDISAVIGTYTDFDIKGDAHKEKCLPESKEVLMAFLASLPRAPTAVVVSGNGIHTYWLFEEIFYIHTEDERDYVEKIVKGWEKFIKDKAYREYGWKFDSVSDLPRMLRAVGTFNHKTPEMPVCKVLLFLLLYNNFSIMGQRDKRTEVRASRDKWRKSMTKDDNQRRHDGTAIHIQNHGRRLAE